MRLPRNLSGRDLATGLRQLGYRITRQTGSHMRVTTKRNGAHHVTIPDHDPVRVGTLSAILADVARHHGHSRDDLILLLFGGK